MAAHKLCEIIPHLPDELIIAKILPRLPVKSIGRCRCVSKPWRSELSTRQFAKTHTKFHADDQEDIIEALTAIRILTLTGEGAVSRQVIFPFQEKSSFLIVGSCDGLILLQTLNLDFRKILMNPITLETSTLPECPDTESPSYSLGYDGSRDDYKVVCLSEVDADDVYKRVVDVYSVRMKCWKRIGPSPYRHTDCDPGLFLNGCVHWFGYDETETCCSFGILLFDLVSEEFRKIPFPRGVIDDNMAVEFWLLDGCLAVMSDLDLSKGFTDIWVMEEYEVQDSWRKRTIRCHPIEEEPYPEYLFFCMLNDEEILLSRDSKQLLAYNLSKGSWRDVVVTGGDSQGLCPTSVTFRESLTSPHLG